ncbi:MAG: hypothetical protein DRI77_14505 [Chloroflexi bacterium]|nr:MAG: hypothetical protein DRI77_14505 [Chloroflexota bacterium]
MEKRRRFVIEIGTGIDLHGRDATKAAARAVKDAISRSCLCGLVEVVELTDLDAMRVDILIGAPHPEQVEEETVMAVVPFGVKNIEVVTGGLQAPGLFVPELGEDAWITIANAVVTVWIE